MPEEFDLEQQIKKYDMKSCIDMIYYISIDMDNLITGQNGSLSMIRMGISKETYQEAIERNLKLINSILKLLNKRMLELNESGK